MERSSDRVARWLLPTLGGLLFLLAYAFTVFLRGGSLFAGDGDPGRHIRVGTYILENRSIPRVDVFSHTMRGHEFIPFEWLSEIFFAAAHIAAGLTGVAVLTGLLFAASVALVYVAIHRSPIPAPIAFAFGLLGFLLQAMHLHPRPHMFTTLLVAIFSLVLLQVRRGTSPRWLLLLPPLMVAWVNLHGGFLVGVILLVVFTTDAFLAWRGDRDSPVLRERIGWQAGVLLACLAVSLLNPAGWELWPHTTGYLGETFLVDITHEYKSPDFHGTFTKVFLVVLLSGSVILGLLRSRVALLGLALWVLFGAFALHSARNIPLFAVVCLPWLAGWTADLLKQWSAQSEASDRFLDWSGAMERIDALLPGWPFALVVTAVLTLTGLHWGQRGAVAFAADVFPVAAVRTLQETGFVPAGPVYNEFAWGGYLLYAWQDIPVFIDGQTDFYGEELTREYTRIRALAPDWEALLEKHEVGWAIIPPHVALNQAFRISSEWSLVYSDSVAVVWSRPSP